MNRRELFHRVLGAVGASIGCQLPGIWKNWKDSPWQEFPSVDNATYYVLWYRVTPQGELEQIYPPIEE